MSRFRLEHDSMGDVQVPLTALYGAQTQRAILNFPISGLQLPTPFISCLAHIKKAAAQTNLQLGLLEAEIAQGIIRASEDIIANKYPDQFPVDVFQTGSGTSTNMNVNEVIARLASEYSGKKIHANDHVNMSQSSNDTIPSAIHISAALALTQQLFPALNNLHRALCVKAEQLKDVVKTGRTHLMDALPITFEQELSGWANQIESSYSRLQASLPQLLMLAQGGTAVGTGVNAHAMFATAFSKRLSENIGITFSPGNNLFALISAQDTAVATSGQLKTLAVSLMKISNDLRWMNSGPLSGIAEITLLALQPGSSIMPGKVNPVVPEAVCMVCAQVMGNDLSITINTMLPLVAYNLLQSIQLLSNACNLLNTNVITNFTVNTSHIHLSLARNPMLVTALNGIVGYEKSADIAKKAYQNNRAIIDVAEEETQLSREELERLLDPKLLTGK
jgi:fumarate hydratase, class II